MGRYARAQAIRRRTLSLDAYVAQALFLLGQEVLWRRLRDLFVAAYSRTAYDHAELINFARQIGALR